MKLDLSPFALSKEDIERSVIDLRTEVIEQAARKVVELDERNVQAAVTLELTRRCTALEAKLAAIESQRPHWAKGYSADSIAAQVSGGALSELWELLGVSNQTDAVEKLQRLVAAEKQEPIYQKRHLDERWWEDTDKNNFDVCTSLRHIETRKVFLCPVPADKPAAPSHSQQSAVYGYVICDGFTEQFVKTLSDDDRKAAQRFNWDVIALCRCPSHESEQS